MFDYKEYARIRDLKGMNDNRVSLAASVSTSTISSWKQGKYTPKIDKLGRIASVLGVTPEAFRTAS